MKQKNGEQEPQQDNSGTGRWNWFKNNYGYEAGKWEEVEQAANYNPEVKTVLNSVRNKVLKNVKKPRSEDDAWNEPGINFRNLNLRLFMVVKRVNADHGNGYSHEVFAPYVKRNPKKYRQYFPAMAREAQRNTPQPPDPNDPGATQDIPSAPALPAAMPQGQATGVHQPNTQTQAFVPSTDNEKRLLDLITQLQNRVAELEKRG